MEVDTQIQHEYITSPTNIDFYTQLVNLNDHADGTTPLHVNGISDRIKFFEGGIQPSSDGPSQKSSFTKQPNSVTQERPESTECELDTVPISTRSRRKSEHVAPINLSRQKLSSISGAAFKTPHNSRLEKISSLRDKLGLIKIDTLNNCSTPHTADRNSQPTVSTAVTPRGTLMVRTTTFPVLHI
jgi:hypothetical protein